MWGCLKLKPSQTMNQARSSPAPGCPPPGKPLSPRVTVRLRPVAPPPLVPLLGVALGLAATTGVAAGDPQPVLLAQAASASEFEQLAQIKVTTVSRNEGTVLQSPAAVFVISQEMIRRSGATAIPELFRMVPGMNVARIDGNKWAVSSRGFNDRFVGKQLVQIDGRTLFNPVLSGVYWDAVDYPLEDIERIEVVRGPGASVWGANAVNGVINIITKSAKETPGTFVTLGGGTEERGFGTVRHGGHVNDELSYRVYGKGFLRQEQFFTLGSSQDDWEGASAGLRLDWQPRTANKFTLDVGYLHSGASRQDFRPLAVAPFVITNTETDFTDAGHVLGRWTRELAEWDTFTLQTYWNRNERRSQHILDWRWDTYDMDFQHRMAVGDRQTLTWGAGYQLIRSALPGSQLDNGFDLSFENAYRTTQLFSAFVQDQIKVIPDRLELTLGSKFEHNDFTGFEVQPTARALLTVSPRQTVWAGVSRAVRTPNLIEDSGRLKILTAPGATTFLEFRGSSNLEAEIVTAYDLGYRFQANEHLSFDLATFYNEYDRLIGTRAGAAEVAAPITVTPLNRANTLKAETYGMELATSWQLAEHWQIHGGYTLLKMNLHRAAGIPATGEAAEKQSPQQQVYLRSSWNLPRAMEFDLIGRFVDRTSGFNLGAPAAGFPNVIDQYFSLDARLGWRPRKGLELSVVGQNLLDQAHPEFGTSPLVRSPLVELRRGFYTKLTWSF